MVAEERERRQTEELKRRLAEALAGNLQPPGTIMLYAGQVPPEDWGICDGAELARDTYGRLFEIIGETFGAGDGQRTFNLPKIKGPHKDVRYIIRLGAYMERVAR